MRAVRASRTDPIMDLLIRGDSINPKVFPIVRVKRDQSNDRKSEENDTEYVIPSVPFSRIRSCFASHSYRLKNRGRMTMLNEDHKAVQELISSSEPRLFADFRQATITCCVF